MRVSSAWVLSQRADTPWRRFHFTELTTQRDDGWSYAGVVRKGAVVSCSPLPALRAAVRRELQVR